MLKMIHFIWIAAVSFVSKECTPERAIEDMLLPHRDTIDKPVHLTFRNLAKTSVSLHRGSSLQYTMVPLERKSVLSRVGEEWHAYAYGVHLLNYVVHVVNIYDCDAESVPLVKCDSRDVPFTGERISTTDSMIFRNELSHPVLLTWYNGTCEEYVDTLPVGHDQHVLSTTGHIFRMRDNSYHERLVTEYVHMDVVIRDTESARAFADVARQIRATTPAAVPVTARRNITFAKHAFLDVCTEDCAERPLFLEHKFQTPGVSIFLISSSVVCIRSVKSLRCAVSFVRSEWWRIIFRTLTGSIWW